MYSKIRARRGPSQNKSTIPLITQTLIAAPDAGFSPREQQMSTADFLIAVAAALIQFGATVLYAKKSEWVISYGGIFQSAIVAAVMIVYLSVVRFILNWRSRRQVGKKLGSPLFNSSVVGLSMAISAVVGLELGPDTFESLWVCGLFAIVRCYLFDLTRADVSSDAFPVSIQPMMMMSILGTKGHLYWKIGFGIILFALVLLVTYRQDQCVAMKKAEDLRKNEHKKTKLKRLEKQRRLENLSMMKTREDGFELEIKKIMFPGIT